MRFRIENKDRSGSVSFAILGVLIILLSIMAVAYTSRIERQDYENTLNAERISNLENTAENTYESIKNTLNLLAIESVFELKEDKENVSDIFDNKVDDYFKKYTNQEGSKAGQRVAYIDDYTITLEEKSTEVDDVVPDIDEEGEYERISTSGPGSTEKREQTFNYIIKGLLNITSKNVNTDDEIQKSFILDETVDVPYPFMRNKAEELDGSLKGEQSHVGRITNYILKTISQYRTLIGYGMEGGSKSTENILTEKDVELAVNLAMILEIAYQYRAIDPEQVETFSNRIESKDKDEIVDIIYHYLDDGEIDPGDLASLFYGYSYDNITVAKEESVALDFASIISQAINSLVDQFILKYLDQLGLMEVSDLIFKGYQSMQRIADKAGDTWDGLYNWVTGQDGDINPTEVELVKNWVSETFYSSGMVGPTLINSQYNPFNNINGKEIVGYPELPSDSDHSFFFQYIVRLTSEDNSWYNFSCEHGKPKRRRGHTCEKIVKLGEDDEGNSVYGRCGAKEELVGYDYLTKECNVHITPGPVLFYPKNILEGNDELWQQFYDRVYRDKCEKEIDSIRDAVRSVIQEIVDAIMGDEELSRSLEEFKKIKVDITDKRTFFHDIEKNVESAISKTFTYYRDNPQKIADIVERYLHGDEEPKVEELKSFLKDNYDELVHKTGYIHNTAARTAELLARADSPYLEYETAKIGDEMREIDNICDFTFGKDGNISKEEVSNIIKEGGVITSSKIEDLISELKPSIESVYEDVKEREIQEIDQTNKRSDKDGLIIQALDDYQFSTEILEDKRNTRTRSGGTQVWIDEINPNPATITEDVVDFRGISHVNYTSIEWISDIDGLLGEELNLSIAADYLSPGSHEIKLSIIDEESTYHNDTEELFINCPPEAKIKEINPSPAGQGELVEFIENSTDPEGEISFKLWSFGDGESAYGDKVEHIYSDPGLYTVNLTVKDSHGSVDYDEEKLYVDEAPYVTEFNPNGTEIWDTAQSFQINFSEPVDPSTFEYEVDPYIDFNVSWSDNVTALLEPQDYYFRETTYTFTVKDVKDIDEGVNTSLLNPEELEWTTEEKGEVNGWLPGSSTPLKLQSSVVLTLTESAYLDESLKEFVSIDKGWRMSWSNDYKHLRLDHRPFSPGSEIEITFYLEHLKSRKDGSRFKYEDKDHMDITFQTERCEKPNILFVSPSMNEEGASLLEDIEIWFDKSMNKSSFELFSTPHLKNPTFNWNYRRDMVRVEHSGFKSSTNYSIFIRAEDTDGNPLKGVDESIVNPLKFKTEDIQESSVNGVFPKDGANHFLSDSPIIVVFDEEMNKDSLDFRCSPDPKGWDVTWNDDSTVVTFHHDDFEAEGSYTFRISKIKDRSGDILWNPVYITFDVSENSRDIDANLFQKKVWSFIGNNKVSDSLFDYTESFLLRTTTEMILSSEMSNDVYRVPLSMQEGFSYGEVGEKLDFLVDVSPNFLDLREDIVISSPEGEHFTSLTELSSRPFTTSWRVDVPIKKVALNVSQDENYVLAGYPERMYLNRSYELGFNLTISVASGWALSGVEYEIDQIELTDILDFLDHVWETMRKPISYLVDSVQNIIELLSNFAEKVKEYAMDMLQLLGEMIKRVIEDMIQPFIDMVPGMIENLKNFEKVLSLLGLDIEIEVFDEGELFTPYKSERMELKFVKLSIGTAMMGTDFHIDTFVLEENIIAIGNTTVGELDLCWQMDPKAKTYSSVYDGWFIGEGILGEKENGALLELTIPDLGGEKEVKEKLEVGASDYIPVLSAISIPIGPVVITNFDLGFVFEYLDVKKSSRSLFGGTFRNTFLRTIESMEVSGIDLDFIIEFVKEFVYNLIKTFETLFTSIIKSASFYLQCMVNGVDVILDFGIHSGQGVIDFIRWIGREIHNLVQGFVKRKPVISNDFPMSILEDTELSVEVGFEDITTKFSANVPAITAIAGKDLGDWRIDFELKTIDYKLVSGYIEEW